MTSGKRAAIARRPAQVPTASSLEDYTFEHGGRQYRLPSFAKLKSGVIRRIRHMDEADAFYTVLEGVADEETLAALDDMDMTELTPIVQGWQAHAGVNLGELQGSST